MSGDVSDKKRLIAVREADLNSGDIHVSGHQDFFPPDCFGKAEKANRAITITADGLSVPVETDIAVHHNSEHPKSSFRKKAWIKEFFQRQNLQEGDIIAIERLDEFTYPIQG